MSSLSDSINDVFSPDSFVPSDLQTRLNDFTDAGVNAINISQFREQINLDILSFNVTTEVMRLEDLIAELNGIVSIIQWGLHIS